jgi:hypothetical protein
MQKLLTTKTKFLPSNKILKELRYIDRIIKDCNNILKNKILNKNNLLNYLNIDIDKLNDKQYVKNKFITKLKLNNIFDKYINDFYNNYNNISENLDDIYENLIIKKNK